MKPFWKSKKFWATVLGLIIPEICTHAGFPLSPETVTEMRQLIGFYLLGQGVSDAGIYHAKIKLTQPTQNPEQLQTKEIL